MRPGTTLRLEAALGRVLIGIVSLTAALALAEVASRFALDARPPFEARFPTRDTRSPRPFCMFGGRPGAPGLNELGYPGAAPASPKPRGEFRVFVLGGSTVWNGDPALPALLEDELARRGLPDAAVYNFGVVSSVSGMELARLVFEVADLEPDLVVFYSGGNDILHPWSWDPRPGHPFNFVAWESNPLLESDVESYPTIALLAYGSHLLRAAIPSFFVSHFVPLDELREQAGWNTEPWRRHIAEHFVSNLWKASRVSKGLGADFVAFLQPLVYFKRWPTREEAPWSADAAKRDHAARAREYILETAARRPEVPLVDLSGFYADRRDPVFSDTIHTRQDAKPALAAEMAGHVAARMSVVATTR